MGYESKIIVVESFESTCSKLMEFDVGKVCYGESGKEFKECFDTELPFEYQDYKYLDCEKDKEIYCYEPIYVDCYGEKLKCCSDKKKLRIATQKIALEYEQENVTKWDEIEMLVEILKIVENNDCYEVIHYGF